MKGGGAAIGTVGDVGAVPGALDPTAWLLPARVDISFTSHNMKTSVSFLPA